jgi:hypothetical protein
MKMMKIISLYSIYMRVHGGQQNICGSKLIQETYKSTSRLTHGEHYTPRVHISSSNVILYTCKAPMQGRSVRCVQLSSYNPPNPHAPLCPLPYMNIVYKCTLDTERGVESVSQNFGQFFHFS